MFDLLGIDVPHMEIPLRPGRDMARLVEVAAMVQSARQLGHDSANDFNEKLLKKMNSFFLEALSSQEYVYEFQGL